MTRTNARELACQLVFEMNFNHVTADEALRTMLEDDYYPTLRTEYALYEEKPSGKQLEYVNELVRGVQARREQLDAEIERLAVNWRVSRISRVAVAIMEVCMYEARYLEDVPVNAAISEAVELTRKYEDEDVVSFVNGILGGFARELAGGDAAQ